MESGVGAPVRLGAQVVLVDWLIRSLPGPRTPFFVIGVNPMFRELRRQRRAI